MPGLRRARQAAGRAAWEGILEVEQHRALPEEIVDFRVDRHVVILHLGPAHWLVWELAGASQQRTLIRDGSLSLIPAGTRLAWSRHDPAEALVAAVEPEFVAALAVRSGHGARVGLRSLIGFEDPAVAHILRAVQLALRDGGSTGRIYLESLTTALVSHLLAHYAVPRLELALSRGLPEARLRRVLDYVEAHLGEDTSVRQLAELARLSPDHFATLFRQSVGLPPHRYVLERRIRKAKELLADERLSMVEIGLAVGYTSQPHFITMFRRQTGMTPGMYRKMCRLPRP